jgi:hypothetical protein
VFVRIEDDFFLLDYWNAIYASEGWTRENFYDYGRHNCRYWNKRVDFEEFHKELLGGTE